MWILFGLLFFMLVGALSILSAPFIIFKKNILNGPLMIFFLTIIIFSLTLYRHTGDVRALSLWLTTGEQHYFLQEKIMELGGIPGMIDRIEHKLQENPQDARGWLILNKLYLSQHEDEKAKAALEKARLLQTKNP